MTATRTPVASIAERVRRLLAEDPAFAAAAPSPDVAAAIHAADGDLIATIAAAMAGYAHRPALARRARRVVRDPSSGALVHEHLEDVETVTYAQLWDRACAFAATVHQARTEAGLTGGAGARPAVARPMTTSSRCSASPASTTR